MSDLVERLRDKDIGGFEIDFEAADEIERLRGACRSYEEQANRDAIRLTEAERLLREVFDTCACAAVDLDSIDAFLAGEKHERKHK